MRSGADRFNGNGDSWIFMLCVAMCHCLLLCRRNHLLKKRQDLNRAVLAAKESSRRGKAGNTENLVIPLPDGNFQKIFEKYRRKLEIGKQMPCISHEKTLRISLHTR